MGSIRVSVIMSAYNAEKFVSEAILSNEDIPNPTFITSHGFLHGTSGDVKDLIKYYGFDSKGIEQKVLKRVLNKK